MKKFFLLLICAAGLFSNEMTVIGINLSSETKGHFILSDGTFWKVAPFIKRWRTVSEWWSGEEISLPDEYNVDMKLFATGDQFVVYPKQEICKFNESFASNAEDLKKTSHALVHRTTGKILFGAPIQPSVFISEIFGEGYAKGYDKGYGEGYSLGKKLYSPTR